MRHKSLIFSFVSFLFLVVTLVWQLKFRTFQYKEFTFPEDNLEIHFKQKFNFSQFNNSVNINSSPIETRAYNENDEKIFHHRFQKSDEANIADNQKTAPKKIIAQGILLDSTSKSPITNGNATISCNYKFNSNASLADGSFEVSLSQVLAAEIIYCSVDVSGPKYESKIFEEIPFYQGLGYIMNLGTILLEREDNKVRLFGKVINHASKMPLINAELILKYWDFRQEHLTVTNTNIRGHYEINIILPSDEIFTGELIVSSPKYTALIIDFNTLRPGIYAKDFELTGMPVEGVIKGKLVGWNMKPLVDAKIRISLSHTPQMFQTTPNEDGIFDMRLNGKYGEVIKGKLSVLSQNTDDDDINGLEIINLEESHNYVQNLGVLQNANSPALIEISGNVFTPSGEKVIDAEMELNYNSLMSKGSFKNTSHREGGYSLVYRARQGIEMHAFVRVWKKNFRPLEMNFTFVPSNPLFYLNKNLQIQREPQVFHISGQLLDDLDKLPVVNAIITLKINSWTNRSFAFTEKTDNAGRFLFIDVEKLEKGLIYEGILEAQNRDYGDTPSILQVNLDESNDYTANNLLIFLRVDEVEASLSGKIVDNQMKGLPQANKEIEIRVSHETLNLKSDANGEFMLKKRVHVSRNYLFELLIKNDNTHSDFRTEIPLNSKNHFQGYSVLSLSKKNIYFSVEGTVMSYDWDPLIAKVTLFLEYPFERVVVMNTISNGKFFINDFVGDTTGCMGKLNIYSKRFQEQNIKLIFNTTNNFQVNLNNILLSPLEMNLNLRGSVWYPDGKVVQGAMISQVPGSKEIKAYVNPAKTDHRGVFETTTSFLYSELISSLNLVIDKPEYGKMITSISFPRTDEVIILKMTQSLLQAKIEGSVLSAKTFMPLAGVLITTFPKSLNEEDVPIYTDYRGKFSINYVYDQTKPLKGKIYFIKDGFITFEKGFLGVEQEKIKVDPVQMTEIIDTKEVLNITGRISSGSYLNYTSDAKITLYVVEPFYQEGPSVSTREDGVFLLQAVANKAEVYKCLLIMTAVGWHSKGTTVTLQREKKFRADIGNYVFVNDDHITYLVKGKVLDKFTELPVPEAHVSLILSSGVSAFMEKAKTDANGEYVLSQQVPKAEHMEPKLEISTNQHKPQFQFIHLSESNKYQMLIAPWNLEPHSKRLIITGQIFNKLTNDFLPMTIVQFTIVDNNHFVENAQTNSSGQFEFHSEVAKRDTLLIKMSILRTNFTPFLTEFRVYPARSSQNVIIKNLGEIPMEYEKVVIELFGDVVEFDTGVIITDAFLNLSMSDNKIHHIKRSSWKGEFKFSQELIKEKSIKAFFNVTTFGCKSLTQEVYFNEENGYKINLGSIRLHRYYVNLKISGQIHSTAYQQNVPRALISAKFYQPFNRKFGVDVIESDIEGFFSVEQKIPKHQEYVLGLKVTALNLISYEKNFTILVFNKAGEPDPNEEVHKFLGQINMLVDWPEIPGKFQNIMGRVMLNYLCDSSTANRKRMPLGNVRVELQILNQFSQNSNLIYDKSTNITDKTGLFSIKAPVMKGINDEVILYNANLIFHTTWPEEQNHTFKDLILGGEGWYVSKNLGNVFFYVSGENVEICEQN